MRKTDQKRSSSRREAGEGEAGGRRQEAGGRRQEAGGSRQQAVGSRQQAAGQSREEEERLIKRAKKRKFN